MKYNFHVSPTFATAVTEFTKGSFGLGGAPTKSSTSDAGNAYDYDYNGDYYGGDGGDAANSIINFDGFTGADLNGPTDFSEEGGSGFPNFSFKKREIVSPTTESPAAAVDMEHREPLNFYPYEGGGAEVIHHDGNHPYVEPTAEAPSFNKHNINYSNTAMNSDKGTFATVIAGALDSVTQV